MNKSEHRGLVMVSHINFFLNRKPVKWDFIELSGIKPNLLNTELSGHKYRMTQAASVTAK